MPFEPEPDYRQTLTALGLVFDQSVQEGKAFLSQDGCTQVIAGVSATPSNAETTVDASLVDNVQVILVRRLYSNCTVYQYLATQYAKMEGATGPLPDDSTTHYAGPQLGGVFTTNFTKDNLALYTQREGERVRSWTEHVVFDFLDAQMAAPDFLSNGDRAQAVRSETTAVAAAHLALADEAPVTVDEAVQQAAEEMNSELTSPNMNRLLRAVGRFSFRAWLRRRRESRQQPPQDGQGAN